MPFLIAKNKEALLSGSASFTLTSVFMRWSLGSLTLMNQTSKRESFRLDTLFNIGYTL